MSNTGYSVKCDVHSAIYSTGNKMEPNTLSEHMLTQVHVVKFLAFLDIQPIGEIPCTATHVLALTIPASFMTVLLWVIFELLIAEHCNVTMEMTFDLLDIIMSLLHHFMDIWIKLCHYSPNEGQPCPQPKL